MVLIPLHIDEVCLLALCGGLLSLYSQVVCSACLVWNEGNAPNRPCEKGLTPDICAAACFQKLCGLTYVWLLKQVLKILGF